MRIGITYDLKVEEQPIGRDGRPLPDDFQEEFDSPATIEAIAEVLRGLGHEVDRLGDGRELLERLLAQPPDFVFNIAEGQGIGRAREARVPAVLELLCIPHTGSDPFTLAVTLDKDCARRLVRCAGVAVPAGVVLEADSDPREIMSSGKIKLPAIVKPAWEGSSKGIRNRCLVNQAEDLPDIVEALRQDHRQPVLVEEFIRGDELTVGIIGNAPPRIVGIMRVLPRKQTRDFIYGLEVKRDYLRQVRYECPARLPAAVSHDVERAALTVYHALGCRDVARVDFRLRDGIPYFLEANPLPGLNPQSGDLVIMARLAGWDYPQVIEAILQAAVARQAKDPCHATYSCPNPV
jgi:D-alanine-D-alanine ligase